VIATDVEHGDSVLDKVLRQNADDADLLIYDAQYTPAEYAVRKGWGHSNYAAAACVANDAKVEKLILFHHDPTHNDAAMADIVKLAMPLFENTIAAQELHTITLGMNEPLPA
jgi:ribonuclease BN (tRNA processing enzyme)